MSSIQEFIDNWKNKDKKQNEKYNKIYYIYKKDNLNIDIKDEDAIMIQFVKDNPFISFKEYNQLAIKNNLIYNNGKVPYVVYLLSRVLYENPTNENKIIEVGKKLYDLGDKKLMRFVYSILSIIHKQYLDPVVNGQNVMYDKYWIKIIDDWKNINILLNNKII